eukprot:TRINITY_DN808_c0_g1_i1.p1 TRINITY_DN808_c0_g1~~TRINITY_DN808_c0_g1_i1.p1  ORF type:complete len:981 (+),score=466.52 TRINITY_DN808_c0_g1_i1:50-2944(+)
MANAKMFIVRGVPSADILAVVDLKNPNQSYDIGKAMRIGIEGIRVPQMGREGPEAPPEEEFGFEAREFVRKQVIGKQVKLVNARHVDQLKRDMGQVFYKDDAGNVKNLGEELVKEGLAEVSDHAVNKDRTGEDEYVRALAAAQVHAMETRSGQFSGLPCREKPNFRPEEYMLEEIAKELKGQKFKATVEAVFAGHSLRVYLPEPLNCYVSVQCSGVICDKKDFAPNPNDKGPKPSDADIALWSKMHSEARMFGERALNHKDIILRVEGLRYDSLVATIENMQGKLYQEELLKKGLATVFNPTVVMCSVRSKLKAAEDVAKAARAGRWANIPVTQKVTTGAGAAAAGAPAGNDFKGQVVQLQSADTLIIIDAANKEHRVCLANVRAGGSTDHLERIAQKAGEVGPPTFAKMTRKSGKEKGTNEQAEVVVYSNWYLESRDFMAKMVLGRDVNVKFEFLSGVASDTDKQENAAKGALTLPPRQNVTITMADSGKNPGEELIRAGWGVPMSTRDGQCDGYFGYCDAFEEAKKEGRGLHGKKKAQDTTVQDMARPNDSKGKAVLGQLQRAGAGQAGVPKLKAFVEFVLSPMRFKLYIPRQNAQISVNIAGIVSPMTPMPGSNDPTDPCAEEALAFSRKLMNQREVEVQVEHFHKGTFVGNVYLNGKNFAPQILAAGLATTEGQNMQSMSGKSEALEAEKQAQLAHVGIWGPNGGLPRRAAEAVERYEKRTFGKVSFQVGAPGVRVPITVTEAESATSFFYQTKEAKEKMVQINNILHQANLDQLPVPTEDKVKKDDCVAAKFSADGKWYRARVIRTSGKNVDVAFVDFGNRESTTIGSIRVHPTVNKTIPPQAVRGRLAFLHDLDAGEPGAMAALDEFGDFVDGREVTAAHEYTDGKQKYFTLRFGEQPVQAMLVKNGLSLVDLKVMENKDFEKPVSKLVALEKAAKQGRKGMWEVIRGDPRSYDDDHY